MDIRERPALVLDGTKIAHYPERIKDWWAGKRIAPVTVDMALTRACNLKCVYCYSQLQENDRKTITRPVIARTFSDFAEIGVRGVSLVSDGESTCSPHLEYAVRYGHGVGLAMALGTNGVLLVPDIIYSILPRLSYLRFNISAGEEARYTEIMGAKAGDWGKLLRNIEYAVAMKEDEGLPCTIGLQMVLMPQFADQILPLAKLAIKLGVDYLVIKHCSDDEDGSLGVDYSLYPSMYQLLKEAEGLSTERTKIVVKWNKIQQGNVRSYRRCYGPPFHIQLSGSGLVAPCGMLFGEKYKEYHIGNIVDTSFKEIWQSERYWHVMTELAGPHFNAQTACGCLCLQHMTNQYLDNLRKGKTKLSTPKSDVLHKEFL